MTDKAESSGGALPTAAVLLGSLLVGGLVVAFLKGHSGIWIEAVKVILSDGALTAVIVVAAGGYGHLLVSRIAPKSATLGLRVVTSAALGLWMLSTAVLIVGSTVGGLRWFVWWPVLAVGLLLTAWQARGVMDTWRWPKRTDGRSLVWLLAAVAAGFLLAGATRPPGFAGLLDGHSYDILEYHLQLPREYFLAGRIDHAPHNVYSHFPLGAHMLFLLGMCLRGGAYEGVYLAQMLHGAFGVLAVLGIFLALRRDDETRGRFAAVLLATTPAVVALGYLAMVELTAVCGLALAVLWLREWIDDGEWGSAAMIGIGCGVACASKYLAVGFVLAPVVAAAFVVSGRSLRRHTQTAAIVVVGLAMLSPWMLRNIAHTGNPMFPLMTRVFGRGHWSAESDKRWTDGHGPDKRPPAPKPADWKPGAPPGPIERLWQNLLHQDRFGPMAMIVAGVAICAMIAAPRLVRTWDWALVGIAGMQIVVWVMGTHEMPWRFILPILVPIVLIGAGGLSRLSRVAVNPFGLKSAKPSKGPWGLAPAAVTLFFAALVNLAATFSLYVQDTRGFAIPPMLGEAIAREVPQYRRAYELPSGSRVLLLGEAKGFYFPTGTRYATVFDDHPLVAMLQRGDSPEKVLRELVGQGITHVWVDWSEIRRLANSYGFPNPIGAEILRRWGGGSLGLEVFEDLGLVGEPVWTPGPDMPAPPTLYTLPHASDAPTTAPATLPSTAPVR